MAKFKSITDFLDRVKDRNLNKKSLESLIKAGALDCFGIERGKLLGNIDLMLDYNKEGQKNNSDQESLFGGIANQLPGLRLIDVGPADQKDILAWEKELLGLYVTGHPLEKFRKVIEKQDMNIKKALESVKEGASVVVAGIINEVRIIQTKNNENMAFLKISDFSGEGEAVVFPRTFKEFKNSFEVDRCLAMKVTVNVRNGEKSFVIDRVKNLA